ncbi:MFS general substrate transporter [Aspergillus pseudodeflectus]|uniref:MFS general substrate transporter n=1 Tax=Aspergillus pseudodeflectus TaxID=176178 RepID=A0ABR4JW48_9EURO
MHFFAAILLGAPAHLCARLSVTCVLILLLGGLQKAAAEIDSAFKSRPDLYPPVFTFERRVPQKLQPGYIFLGPYEADNSGPYIYDNDGNLVWSGWGNSGPGNAHGMHVCQYRGKDHLCFFQGIQQNGYCRGHGVIMDEHYHIVKTVVPGGGMAASDMHEFKLINNGKTALMTVYQQRQFDMSIWNVKGGMGWLMESVFQEIDVETNKVLFEWRSLDHVDPSVSYTYPGHTDTSGTGLEPRSPWDYFHINSVDKNADGDYLISSRHTCAIYKISGKDGSVLWQLHGANPSFKNINFSFSQQHDARWLTENGTHTLLSLYNNGFNGFNRTHDYSSGMLILINHVDQTATQLHEYAPQNHDMISSSQGNMQVLPNGNVFIGWGNNAYVSEHDAEGNLLLWGYIDKGRIMNYRAQKFHWEGNPTDIPALWTYSKTTDAASPTTFYVSWNGATRVKHWRFYGLNNSTDNYTLIHQSPKDGFETSYTASEFYRFTYAEAIDAQGKVLGKSREQFTFTPSPALQEYCSDTTCENTQAYGVPGEEDAKAIIPQIGLNTVPWVDPDEPGVHLNWGNKWPPAPENEPSGALKNAYNRVGWVAPSLGIILTVVAIYVVRLEEDAERFRSFFSNLSALMTGSNRQPLASSVSPNNSSNPSSSSAVMNPKNRNAHHSRKTSWASGLDKGGEPSPDFPYPQQRRRADSLAHVSEGSSGRYEEDDEAASASNMALRNTSLDWNEGHARSRSQSQPQMPAFDPIETSPGRPGPVTWMSLPQKKQLALLGLCRVFDFLQIASLQAYMFYQLKSFDETLSDSDVSTQAGILQGAFTAAQFATAIPWGRVADAEWGGRKFVLLVGLLGTAVSCLGVAYSTSFAQAVFWRSFGGAINGTVGIIRTMIAENVKEKKYHSRAFLILPIGFNIAALFGPVMGGMLSDPVRSYPRLFGPNSSFGGENGVEWLMRYPYALPMLANAVFLTFCAGCVALGLEETLQACKGKPGLGVFCKRLVSRGAKAVIPSSSPLYSRLPFADYDESGPLLSRQNESYELEEKAAKPGRHARVLPFRQIWTKNVLSTLLAQAFFDFQMGAFNNLWLLFLSTPRYDSNDPASPVQRLPFVFTGGLGMLPQSVGFATAILGVIGMMLQFTIYPSINSRLGTAKSYQYFLTLFPVAYAFAPYIALAPSTTPPPGQANGGWVWFSIIVVLFLQVTARTFTLPTSIILLNNCSPHPSVLGTIHGIGQSVSSAFRTIGPIFSGAWYGYGLEIGTVGFAWWLIALVSVFGCVAAIFVYEGSGHEVYLPGEEEDM